MEVGENIAGSLWIASLTELLQEDLPTYVWQGGILSNLSMREEHQGVQGTIIQPRLQE